MLVLPIRDHNPSQRTAFVTYTLIAANVAVFLGYWPLQSDQSAIARLYHDWALLPAYVTHGHNVHTLVTSTFLHGGFLHLAGNMLFLWIFGDNLEADLGSFRYLLFYLACGAGAGLAHLLADPYSTTPTVGASGAIAGIMGGYMLLYPRARVDVVFFFIIFLRIVAIPAWAVLGCWFLLQPCLRIQRGHRGQRHRLLGACRRIRDRIPADRSSMDAARRDRTLETHARPSQPSGSALPPAALQRSNRSKATPPRLCTKILAFLADLSPFPRAVHKESGARAATGTA